MGLSSAVSCIFSYLFNVRTILYLSILTLSFKYIIKKFSRDSRLVNFSKRFTGPYAFPIIGNSLDILLGGKDGVAKLFMKCVQKYGSTFRLWFGKHLVVVLSRAEDIEVVLSSSKTLGKPEIFMMFKDFFGDALTFATVPLWKKNRKCQQPFFGKNVLRAHVPEMNDLIYKYIEDMKVHVNGPEFDCTDYMNYLSFDTITKTHFDFELTPEEKKQLQFHRIVETATEVSSLKMFRAWLHNQFVRNLVYKKKLDAEKEKAYVFIKKILHHNYESDKVNVDELEKTRNLTSKTVAKSFLNVLNKMQKDAGIDHLMFDDMINTVAGGTETTGITMSSFFLAIAMNPKIQEKLYEELQAVYGDSDRRADEADFDRLPYLDQVIKETQRRFTLIPSILRNVDEDIKIGDVVYPSGTALLINIGGLHYNPEYYPNPMEFNPDNFHPDAVEKRHRYSFLPFSAGARNCLGKSFAELAMKLRVIALMRTFTFHTTTKPEDIKLNAGIVVYAVNGYPVSIKLRKKSSK